MNYMPIFLNLQCVKQCKHIDLSSVSFLGLRKRAAQKAPQYFSRGCCLVCLDETYTGRSGGEFSLSKGKLQEFLLFAYVSHSISLKWPCTASVLRLFLIRQKCSFTCDNTMWTAGKGLGGSHAGSAQQTSGASPSHGEKSSRRWILWCWDMLELCRKALPHSPHVYGFSPVWILRCCRRYVPWLKAFLQSVHLYGFSPWCDLWWWMSLELLWKAFPHSPHL